MGCEPSSSGYFSGLFFLCEQTNGNRDDPDLPGSLRWIAATIKTRTIYGSPTQLKNSKWL